MTRAYNTATTQQNSGGAVAGVAAGKNGAFNGAFDFWQRGTSFTTNGYSADRWYFFPAGVAGRTCTRQSSGLTGFNYCSRVARDSGNTGTTNIGFAQSFATEEALRFAGQTVTFSFYARAGANYSPTSSSLTPYIISGTGTDQNRPGANYTGETIVSSSAVTLTTTWQRFTKTATFASTVTEFSLYFEATPTGTAGAADYYEVTGVQLEVGSVATPFARAGGTLQGELAACQRYFNAFATGAGSAIALGSMYSATQLDAVISFPTMRIAPTLSVATGADWYYFYRNGALDAFNGFTANAYTTPSTMAIYNNTNISGTAGHVGMILSANAGASITLSAEL
jgi:hypothetical protein